MARSWSIPPWRGLLLAAVLLLSACATPVARQQLARTDLPRQIELADTPFFPQEEYQCGPAALATVLTASGKTVAPDELTNQVYVPARQGSLQIEMLAAARRHGRVATVLPPRLDALLDEVRAGHPVLVMQNLGLSWWPSWHYAVVVGYNLEHDEMVLRSGTFRRQLMSLTAFENTWARSEHWAVAVLPPDTLPVSADEAGTTAALVAFDRLATRADARSGYASALKRWPNNPMLAIGLGNTAYAMHDLPAARRALEQALAAQPDNAAAHNNLAVVLADQGELEQARRHAERALALGGPWQETARATLQEIEKKAAKPGVR
ncbi:PA2778 family cysteine peptidase [Pseudogulbenkiania subflava]|uniref:Tetratricopeptide repeat-containing protein n=1 Tax=Pseudogulbenkiania subflava DSM 22618 TaxID=1123014 RepID=A0A1Y6BA69_9NEIS|nr:PA2778 family cysteine peptidase [Pseudogulbenkiania subflava]SME93780.1 Tetratricopeptide repeat-containing protein [Pseudogulbenkiania subflava DSM 22618]